MSRSVKVNGILADPALARLWDAVAERLQRNGISPRGTIPLTNLDQAERFALAGLIGRPVTEPRVRVDLATLDERLRSSGAADGLVAAVSGLRGTLVDRPGERSARVARREVVWATYRAELAACGLDREPWCEAWVESLRSLVGRDPGLRVSQALGSAARCLEALAGRSDLVGASAAAGSGGRGELAAAVVGDSHGLDDGTLVGTMVLRGLAARFEAPIPATAESRRSLWALAGVLCDEVSTTVMTLGLRPRGDGASPVASWLAARSEAGWETHLSLRDLGRLARVAESGDRVFVCENPRVLEAAMDAGSTAAVVCSSGSPTVVVTALLERLVTDGAALSYRGDFDWPGLAIANRVIERHGAEPWRMGVADYELALAEAGARVAELPELRGRSVRATWDPELGPAMERAGRVVHEERILDLLVADLSRNPA
jgi:uncharacterized protein (TIGR02679 family)